MDQVGPGSPKLGLQVWDSVKINHTFQKGVIHSVQSAKGRGMYTT